jgi:D-alanyl-D-alanine carboxypeptidase
VNVLTEALITRTREELGIPRSYCVDRGMPTYEDAVELVSAGLDVAGREQWLRPAAAAAWHRMRAEAESDGAILLLVSAFRSFDQQRGILARKLVAGQTLEDILAVNMPPGYSQHHSGNAVDLATPGCALLSEDFERTEAFAWLRKCAASHGFSLTYPRGNSYGINYEPWHWAFSSDDKDDSGPQATESAV